MNALGHTSQINDSPVDLLCNVDTIPPNSVEIVKEQKVHKAIYGSEKTPLKIGNLQIPAYVLDNGKRVLSQRGMQTALGITGGSSGSSLVKLLNRDKLANILTTDIKNKLNNYIVFQRSGAGGAAPLTYGYEATILLDICDVLLEARKKDILTPSQMVMADQAEILVRAVSKVGLIALIDEATGYQEVRDKQALQHILDLYLDKEFAAWSKRFPDEFYHQIFRLKGWRWPPEGVKRPMVIGHYTNDVVYSRLAPGIAEELKARNPTVKAHEGDKTYRRVRHHQWLNSDMGHPRLAEHIYAILGLMRASKSWEEFKTILDNAFPRKDKK